MLTKRNRDLPSQKTEPTAFAARAKDLGAWRDAVLDGASVGTGLWFSYLFALFYLAIAAGAVTHRDLLLENAVKLPFLNVELPLKAFFILGPLFFLIVHAYVLLHFVLLAGKIGAFHLELQTQITGDEARTRLRRQLPSNIFVQSLAGPREVRTGIVGFLLRRILDISLVIGPIALLILFQLQFLPYHNEGITYWQRLAVVIDLVLLWILWPSIARGETARLRWNNFQRVKVLASLLASTVPVVLVFTIATFPGEWLEENLPPMRLIPTMRAAWTSPSSWATLHEVLVAGQVNYVTGRPQSLWSNVLVLPNFEVGDRLKIDAEGKIAISSETLSLRGRSLEGAVLVAAHLRKADFTAARLAGANFLLADLHEANFACGQVGIEQRCTQLQGAVLDGAQLQGASLNGAQLQGSSFSGTLLQGTYFSAQLQGASLDKAQLQGARLGTALLQGASLESAQLQGALFINAKLQGAYLFQAQLQGANLYQAELQGASLDDAQLQGAELFNARLDGAALNRIYVWRTDRPLPLNNTNGASVAAPEPRPKYLGLDCPGVCDWSERSYAALKSLIEESVPAEPQQHLVLRQIARLEKPPYVTDEDSEKAWTDLAKQSALSAGSYFNRLAKLFKEIGCAAEGAPYVAGGLSRRLENRFASIRPLEAEVAAAFLDDAACPGARGLSEENKAKLQAIRDGSLSKSH